MNHAKGLKTQAKNRKNYFHSRSEMCAAKLQCGDDQLASAVDN